jgi:hypothetical protein
MLLVTDACAESLQRRNWRRRQRRPAGGLINPNATGLAATGLGRATPHPRQAGLHPRISGPAVRRGGLPLEPEAHHLQLQGRQIHGQGEMAVNDALTGALNWV